MDTRSLASYSLPATCSPTHSPTSCCAKQQPYAVMPSRRCANVWTPPRTPTASRRRRFIYTAEGDSYGTLGGLVELADPGNLEVLIERALDSARWCGADPVCMNPPEGAGLSISRGCCHHCLLIPETSCELFNDWLDRAALVVGRANTPPYFDQAFAGL